MMPLAARPSILAGVSSHVQVVAHEVDPGVHRYGWAASSFAVGLDARRTAIWMRLEDILQSVAASREPVDPIFSVAPRRTRVVRGHVVRRSGHKWTGFVGDGNDDAAV